MGRECLCVCVCVYARREYSLLWIYMCALPAHKHRILNQTIPERSLTSLQAHNTRNHHHRRVRRSSQPASEIHLTRRRTRRCPSRRTCWTRRARTCVRHNTRTHNACCVAFACGNTIRNDVRGLKAGHANCYDVCERAGTAVHNSKQFRKTLSPEMHGDRKQ